MTIYVVLMSIPFEGLQDPVAAFTSEADAQRLADMLSRESQHVVRACDLNPFDKEPTL